jgi:hypothetical protein
MASCHYCPDERRPCGDPIPVRLKDAFPRLAKKYGQMVRRSGGSGV